jgi:agmatine deiminase
VILPKYGVDDAPDWVMKKDEKAKEAMQAAFKNREIKMIDAIDLNYKGGGLHCATLPKPKSKNANAVMRLFMKRRLG